MVLEEGHIYRSEKVRKRISELKSFDTSQPQEECGVNLKGATHPMCTCGNLMQPFHVEDTHRAVIQLRISQKETQLFIILDAGCSGDGGLISLLSFYGISWSQRAPPNYKVVLSVWSYDTC